MDEKAELLEYLRVIEMKLASLQRDVRNVRSRIEDCDLQKKAEQRELNFFVACKADDDDAPIPSAPPSTARK
jgi:hypothetical protein